MSTVIIGGITAAILAAAVVGAVKQSCKGDCSSCSSCSGCAHCKSKRKHSE